MEDNSQPEWGLILQIAEVMMQYTKNNILTQSTQAMLAQANQVPQGVLQLLG